MNSLEIEMRVLLVTMTLLSLVSGFAINGQWGFVYQYEFIEFPASMLHEFKFRDSILWCVVIISHIGIILLPFFTRKDYFKKMLLYFPLIYLIAYLILMTPVFILLIPFLIVWLITLVVAKRSL